MPATGAERQRKYRQKLKEENPEKFWKIRKENLERTKRQYKKVSELTKQQQELLREKWRQRKHKKNKECQIEETIPTPPKSIDKSNVDRRRRYKLLKENLNLRSTIVLLVNKAKAQKKTIYRYKKQIEKLNQRVEILRKKEQEQKEELNVEVKETPRSKTERILNEAIPQISSPAKSAVKKILFENVLLKEALSGQYSQAKNNTERNAIKKVINNDITGKYKMRTKLGTCIGLSGRLRIQKKLNDLKMKRLKKLVEFYERDDISRATAGKKQYRTLHKVRKQVRYLLDSLKNLHKKYKCEGGKLAYPTFTRYKPFYVLSPKLVDRNTCACVKHANLNFMCKKLKHLKIISTENLTELVSAISCNINNVKCMYNECNSCSHKKIQFNMTQTHLNSTDIVMWNRWITKEFKYLKNTANQQDEEKTTKRTVKEETTGSLDTLLHTFSNQLSVFKKHYFNIKHQFEMYTYSKNNLSEKEIVLHCDFSENYICKFTEEVQAMHFGASKRQITLHTGVIYAKKQERSRTISFCTISQNNYHNPGAIWAHLTPVLKFVKDTLPEVGTIHFYSDGPTTQYRQKKNFYMINSISQFGFEKATWSFFEASHGKGAADGIGGAAKRTLDTYVTLGQDIPNAEEAYHALVRDNSSKINYFYVSDENIKALINKLDASSIDLIPVPNTMSIHQVISTSSPDIIKFRKLSCFCGIIPGFCDCYDLKEHNLKQKKKMNNRKEKSVNRRRATYSKTNLQADDSDTSTDSEISYAESEYSIWANDEDAVEIEQSDKDDMNNENEDPTILVKDNTVKHNAIEKKNKVKILGDIRNTPENQAYFDLKKYGPFTKIDKDFDVFNTVRNLNENEINIYDHPVPSTSGYKEKQQNRIKIELEDKTSTLKKRQIDNKCTNLKSMNQDLRDETDTISKKSIEGRKKAQEIKNTLVVKDVGKNKKDSCDIQLSCSQTMREKTEESNKLPEANLHTYLTINDNVLVRYFEKKSWVYYIGFIESLEIKEQELYYYIRFLKTIKKPTLKFIVTRKIDKDMVPAICIVKKVELKYESKEYLLSNEDDRVYFD